jgi:cyclic pyranopterin phosphate synthase
MHPVGMGLKTFSEHVALDAIEEYLRAHAEFVAIKRMHNRPVYKLENLIVEIVKPYDNPFFCAGCTRIRLTSEGTLKSCLYREDRIVDILGILRGPYSEEAKRELLREAIKILVALREPNFKWRLVEARQAS